MGKFGIVFDAVALFMVAGAAHSLDCFAVTPSRMLHQQCTQNVLITGWQKAKDSFVRLNDYCRFHHDRDPHSKAHEEAQTCYHPRC